ncbi:hypothetical protein DL93DRAFT_2152890 [Clavulina sp. PMI_390]|nr:hypothetical protein DL93DRAFT_2152890 [Clavulina sp. PMI_390]
MSQGPEHVEPLSMASGTASASPGRATSVEEDSPSRSRSQSVVTLESSITMSSGTILGPRPSAIAPSHPAPLPPKPAASSSREDDDSDDEDMDLDAIGVDPRTLPSPMAPNLPRVVTAQDRKLIIKARETLQRELGVEVKKRRSNKTHKRGGAKKARAKALKEKARLGAAKGVLRTPHSQGGSDDTTMSEPTTVYALPFELIAEITSYLRSQDLLNLARTSKWFCHTLVHADSAFLWRHAREMCLPRPLPDPNSDGENADDARARTATGNGGGGVAAVFNVAAVMLQMLGLAEPGGDAEAMAAAQIAAMQNIVGVQALQQEPQPEAVAAGGPGTAATAAAVPPSPSPPAPALPPEEVARLEDLAQRFPRKQWTEWGWAAFCLDSGPCSICGEVTTNPYWSYALRYRKCGRPQCKDSQQGLRHEPGYSHGPQSTAQFPRRLDLMRALPHAGSHLGVESVDYTRYYRAEEWKAEVTRYEEAAIEDKEIIVKEWLYRGAEIRRQDKIFKSLRDWRRDWEKKWVNVRHANDIAWKGIAKQNKIDKTDLVNAPTLQRMLHESSYALETITKEEWEASTGALLLEAKQLAISRKRRVQAKEEILQHATLKMFYQFLVKEYHLACTPPPSTSNTEQDPSPPAWSRGTAAVQPAKTLSEWFPPAEQHPTGPTSNMRMVPVIPPFSEFRQLSTVKLMTKDLKFLADKMGLSDSAWKADAPFGSIVRADMRQWAEAAKLTLGRLLKQGPPSAANRNTEIPAGNIDGKPPAFPPHVTPGPSQYPTSDKPNDLLRKALVDRPTGLFLCSLCEYNHQHRHQQSSSTALSNDSERASAWRALSFPEVVRHVCNSGSWTKDGVEWNVAHFAPDWHAISVVKEVLREAKIDEDLEDVRVVREKLGQLERKVKCESCKGNLVVPLKDLPRHARRHDIFKCSILESDHKAVLVHTTKRMVSGSGSGTHHQSNEIKKYGCKHCPGSKQHLTFNGLRSHLSAKHGYHAVGDEDFFVWKDMQPLAHKQGGRVVTVDHD